jgi:hypothetical protein
LGLFKKATNSTSTNSRAKTTKGSTNHGTSGLLLRSVHSSLRPKDVALIVALVGLILEGKVNASIWIKEVRPKLLASQSSRKLRCGHALTGSTRRTPQNGCKRVRSRHLTRIHQIHGVGSIALLLRLLELSKAKQALKVHATATHCSLLVGKRSLLLHRSIGLSRTQILTINVAGCAKTLLAHTKLLAKKLCACTNALLPHAKLLTKKLCACAHALLAHAETLTKKLGTKAKVAAFKV